jgi:chromosome segregation ATPase
VQTHDQEVAQLRADLEESSRAAAELQRTRYALAEVSGRLADSSRELALAKEQLARMTAERDHLEVQVRSERIKAQAARRDTEKLQKQTGSERQSILDVLNDLVVEHAALKQTADQQARQTAETIRQRDHDIEDYRQQLSGVTAALEDIRQSISFRVMVTAGRPVAALLRLLRPPVSHG